MKPEQDDRHAALCDALRSVRKRYDALERGRKAKIRRCRTASDLALEGTFWQIGDALAREERHLAHVVLLFPLASQIPHVRDAFSLGRYLRKHLGEKDGSSLRFRRLLDSRDRDDLDHRLRSVIRLAARERVPIDWGVLGTDVLWFFAESDSVRRRWAQDFYAPTFRDASADAGSPLLSVQLPDIEER
jgi:CRISPR type I-E-associated protein CasB/Cse2